MTNTKLNCFESQVAKCANELLMNLAEFDSFLKLVGVIRVVWSLLTNFLPVRRTARTVFFHGHFKLLKHVKAGLALNNQQQAQL